MSESGIGDRSRRRRPPEIRGLGLPRNSPSGGAKYVHSGGGKTTRRRRATVGRHRLRDRPPAKPEDGHPRESVLAFSPSSSAAPRGPDTRPPAPLERGQDRCALVLLDRRAREQGKRPRRGAGGCGETPAARPARTGAVRPGQDDRPLDRVLQLPDVARPVAGRRAGATRPRRDAAPSAKPARGRLDEVLGQQRDVLAALAQRRDLDREHVEPVEQVRRGSGPPRPPPRGRGSWRRRSARRPCAAASPPTRSNSFSWSTRRSLACIASGISPISSRNSVPPCAASKRPARSCTPR